MCILILLVNQVHHHLYHHILLLHTGIEFIAPKRLINLTYTALERFVLLVTKQR